MTTKAQANSYLEEKEQLIFIEGTYLSFVLAGFTNF